MADYKVGNLQIVFDTLNQTDEGFKKLASNLRSVQKAIAKIGDTDLNPFVANIKQITESFTPLLTNISGASEGIIALNQAIQKVGVKNLTKAAEEAKKLQREAEETTNSIANLNAGISEVNKNVLLLGLGSSLKEMRGGTAGYNWVGDYALQVQGAIKYSDEFRESIIRLAEQMALSQPTYDEASKKVSDLASQWKNLYANLIQNNDKYGLGFVEQANQGLAMLSQQYKEAKQVIDTTNDAFKRMTMSTQELVIYDYQLLVAEKQKEIQFRQIQIATGQAGEKTAQYKQEIAKLEQELAKLQKPLKNSTSGFSKFVKSIGRIALYRAIRRGLQLITGSFKEGVETLANFDSGFNKTMSQITTSLTVIKTSLGSVVMPILTAIAPALQEISVGFANLGNVINASMAKMQGLATYTKINTDKLLEYGKASKGVLLDFDKFRALNKQEDTILSTESIESLNEELGVTKYNYQGIYFLIKSIGDLLASVLNLVNKIASSSAVKTIIGVVSWVVGGLAKAVSWLIDLLDKSGLIEPILWGIFAILVKIGLTKIFTWFASGKFVELFATLITKLHLTKGGLSDILTSTNLLIISIGALVGSISYFLTNLDKMGNTAKWLVPLIAGVVGIIVGLTTALIAFYSAHLGLGAAIKAGVSAAAITAAIALAIGTSVATAQNSATAMADGGIPSVGTLFYAGEAGAETVTVGSSGRTEVTNVSQMEEALYNALVRYGRDNRGTDSAININIDGQKVFEVTRRNAQRRGLDFKRV